MVCANPMFGAFEVRTDADATRRYTVTTGIALVVLLGLAGAAVAFSGGDKEKEEEPEVIDVTFQAPAEEAPPPPPAPPPPVNRPKPRSDAPKVPSRAPETPTQLTEEKLEEADENRFQVADTGGEGGGDMVAGGEVGMVGSGIGKVDLPPPPPKPKKEKVAKAGPIQMPENATPPRPVGGNAPPAYPEDARASGIEGEVFLKIVINEDGSVGDIEVKKGEEPFVSAAIAAVKAWTYTPALLDGKPITVFRIIKVPFKLKA